MSDVTAASEVAQLTVILSTHLLRLNIFPTNFPSSLINKEKYNPKMFLRAFNGIKSSSVLNYFKFP